jgi:hypothetical protein
VGRFNAISESEWKEFREHLDKEKNVTSSENNNCHKEGIFVMMILYVN